MQNINLKNSFMKNFDYKKYANVGLNLTVVAVAATIGVGAVMSGYKALTAKNWKGVFSGLAVVAVGVYAINAAIPKLQAI